MLKEHLALLHALRDQDVPLPQRRGILSVLSHQVGYMDQETYQLYKAQADATRTQMERVTRHSPHARPPEGVE